MYVRNDASKMVFQYNSRIETEMPVTSDFGHRTSDLFVLEYWVTGKLVDNHYIN